MMTITSATKRESPAPDGCFGREEIDANDDSAATADARPWTGRFGREVIGANDHRSRLSRKAGL